MRHARHGDTETEGKAAEFSQDAMTDNNGEWPDKKLEVIGGQADDSWYVDPPTPPEQPVLGGGRIAIVCVIATLFGVAIVLLSCAVVVRMLGL